LDHGLPDLLDWTSADRDPGIDPVVEAALTHYQFETLHPWWRSKVVVDEMQRRGSGSGFALLEKPRTDFDPRNSTR
jgi:hypothetical protein